ncbi:MAG: HAMP domain-containing sensor histidine kinase [Emergencia sp.]|nr:HAMP domain-containing sensor histidine kinase [Emergencia sp.]
MKRNKDKRIKGRFVTIVLWKYIVFSIVLVLLLFITLFMTAVNYGKYQNVPNVKELAQAFEGKMPETYADVDIERILGKSAYIQILDDEKRVVYSNNKAYENEDYTDDEINFISEYDNLGWTTVERFETEQGTERVISTISYTKEGEEVKNAVYVINDDLNILYSTEAKHKEKLTRREYNLLTNYASMKYEISKCHFTDANGESHVLLAFCPKGFLSTVNRVKETFLMIIIQFVLIYVLLVVLFSIWVSVKIRKPLRMLSTAMTDISLGRRDTVLDYRGPKEFVEICDNFNNMSVALSDAEEANRVLQEEKQKMIADISHDLKTPITVIKGYSKAIRDNLVGQDEVDKYLETIYQRSEELTDLINEFHEYAKMDHPDNNFTFEQKDICEFTRSYFAERYNEFDIGGYALDIDISEEKLILGLDQGKFRKVYDNILSNFFKYNVPGTTFHCSIEGQKNQVIIRLADNGAGIPEDIRSTVFEPFIVGEKARNRGGSGLGLPLVKKIVEGHGGTIGLSEDPKKGMNTEFVIRIYTF